MYEGVRFLSAEFPAARRNSILLCPAGLNLVRGKFDMTGLPLHAGFMVVVLNRVRWMNLNLNRLNK